MSKCKSGNYINTTGTTEGMITPYIEPMSKCTYPSFNCPIEDCPEHHKFSNRDMTPPVEESWKGRFDSFHKSHYNFLGGISSNMVKYYKAFIAKEIDKAYVKGYQDGSGKIVNDVVALKEQYDRGYQEGVNYGLSLQERPEEVKEKILKEFQEEFGQRLAALESMWQNHGGEQWNSITISEWLSQSLDTYGQAVREEYQDKCSRRGKKT